MRVLARVVGGAFLCLLVVAATEDESRSAADWFERALEPLVAAGASREEIEAALSSLVRAQLATPDEEAVLWRVAKRMDDIELDMARGLARVRERVQDSPRPDAGADARSPQQRALDDAHEFVRWQLPADFVRFQLAVRNVLALATNELVRARRGATQDLIASAALLDDLDDLVHAELRRQRESIDALKADIPKVWDFNAALQKYLEQERPPAQQP